MRNRRRSRFLRRLVLGLAVVAVAAPVAQARVDENGSGGGTGAAISGLPLAGDSKGDLGAAIGGLPLAGDSKGDLAPTSPSGLPVAGDDKIGLVPSPDLATHPDNRAVRYGPGFDPSAGADDGQQAYRGYLPSDYGFSNVLVTAEPRGFDWGDAGIGAGMLFAVMLLAAGGLVAARHLSRTATA